MSITYVTILIFCMPRQQCMTMSLSIHLKLSYTWCLYNIHMIILDCETRICKWCRLKYQMVSTDRQMVSAETSDDVGRDIRSWCWQRRPGRDVRCCRPICQIVSAKTSDGVGRDVRWCRTRHQMVSADSQMVSAKMVDGFGGDVRSWCRLRRQILLTEMSYGVIRQSDGVRRDVRWYVHAVSTEMSLYSICRWGWTRSQYLYDIWMQPRCYDKMTTSPPHMLFFQVFNSPRANLHKSTPTLNVQHSGSNFYSQTPRLGYPSLLALRLQNAIDKCKY